MKVRCLAVLVLAAVATGQAAAAACPRHAFTPPSQVKVGGDAVLILLFRFVDSAVNLAAPPFHDH